MKLLVTEKAISIEEYNDFETTIGTKLGYAFKAFYLKNNGGVPTHEYFGEFTVQVFSPIKYGEWTIEEKHKNFRKHNPDKLNYLPFGHDSGGNPYLLNFIKGTIHILYMGDEDLTFVANSFEELINGLTLEMDADA